MAVKIGILGMGFMGNMHFEAYAASRRARIVAIGDVNTRKLRADAMVSGNIRGGGRRRDLTGIATCRHLDTMLKIPDIDVIDITLPTYLHAEYAIKALEAGRHVICEKPMALNARDAGRMIAAAKRAGRMLFVGHCIRFWPEYQKAAELVKSGNYGKVVSARFIRLSLTPTWGWRNWLLDPAKSGGAALDLHIHDSDFILQLFGKPRTVTSRGASPESGRLDHIVTVYEYAPGVLVTAEGAWEYAPGFGFEMSFVIAMQKATLVLTPDLKLNLHPVKGRSARVRVPKGDGYVRELKHFVDCVATGRPSEVLTPESAMESVKLVTAEIRSALTGKTVPVRF